MNFEKMISTIDAHVAGEAFRIVIHSSITLDKGDIKANHDLLQENYRNEKQLLLNEPRGHPGINGCNVLSSNVADYGLLFFNHDSVIQFNYAALVATVTALLETGNLPKNGDDFYKIETINGVYVVKANFENQEVTSVYFESEGCRIIEKNLEYSLVEIDGPRNYLITELPDEIASISLDHLSTITKWGKYATQKYTNEEVVFDGIIITEPTNATANEVSSVTFEKDGSILRSPGIDSTFAILTAMDDLESQKRLTNKSIFGSSLTAQQLADTSKRFYIETQGFITGIHQFIYDQADPLKNGFLLN